MSQIDDSHQEENLLTEDDLELVAGGSSDSTTPMIGALIGGGVGAKLMGASAANRAFKAGAPKGGVISAGVRGGGKGAVAGALTGAVSVAIEGQIVQHI